MTPDSATQSEYSLDSLAPERRAAPDSSPSESSSSEPEDEPEEEPSPERLSGFCRRAVIR